MTMFETQGSNQEQYNLLNIIHRNNILELFEDFVSFWP